jgi:acyl-coenzyme A synthetase/AMP-(fatty) acid ligase/thioesterase domain-containing protein/acyl carrier protein
LSLIEQAMRRYSARPAIDSTLVTWTYAELDDLSADCAGVIADKCGDLPGPVAILMNHGAGLLAAMVGVARSGCFYIVLNRTLPPGRLAEVLKNVRPKVTIADSEHFGTASDMGAMAGELVRFEKIPRGAGRFARQIEPSEDSPFALFYTSGSSGQAKALIWTHGGTLHNALHHARALGITSQDRLSLLSPCWAAASVSSLFGALLHGACIFPFDPANAGFRGLQRWIDHKKITVYHSVPSLFRRFIESLEPDARVDSIRAVKLGGEPMFPTDVERFRKHFNPGTVLINGLGLTEANGNVCHFRIDPETVIATPAVPVGKALEGIQIRLLADGGGEVEPGQAGEMALRGPFLSPGIWNGAEMERQGSLRDGWLRTGDLARRDAAGVYEHLGRKDGQIKLRGLWLTPSEAEAALLRIAGVMEAAVVAVEARAQGKVLVAYACWRGEPLPELELRAELGRDLPPHLVPVRCVALPELPLLPNGKVDRFRLSEKAVKILKDRPVLLKESKDPLELRLVQIWENILPVKHISVSDDFFALGGDSLSAVSMFAWVEKWLGVHLPPSTLLRAETVEKLAAIIRKGGWSSEDSCLVPLQVHGTKPPLYCVPGAGCHAFSYRALARNLGDQQPLFAFQLQGIEGRLPNLRTVEEIASSCLDALRRHKPNGPYCLCGASFGGVVAFEMARRLVAEGERVPFVGLFDSRAGEYPKVKARLSLRNRMRLAVHNLIFLTENQSLTRQDLKRALRVARQDWPRLWTAKLLHRTPWRPASYKLRFACQREACFVARRKYSMQAYPGRLHLFRVEAQPPADLFEADPELGWTGMATGGLRIIDVPGGHGFEIQEPHVAVLAAKLSAALDLACRGCVCPQAIDH